MKMLTYAPLSLPLAPLLLLVSPSLRLFSITLATTRTCTQLATEKRKRRKLGNVKFIGELFKATLISERIIHECIKGMYVEIIYIYFYIIDR